MTKTRHSVKICMSESCRTRGGEELLACARETLGETASVEAVGCFGLCPRGPVVKIDDRIYEGVDVQELRELLKDLE